MRRQPYALAVCAGLEPRQSSGGALALETATHGRRPLCEEERGAWEEGGGILLRPGGGRTVLWSQNACGTVEDMGERNAFEVRLN